MEQVALSAGSKPSVRFEVEKVIGVSEDGNYQVQWAPAWVSKFHLVGCEHLIQEFLQQQCEKEREDKIPSVPGQCGKICHNQFGLTGENSLQQPPGKVTHTEDVKGDDMQDSVSTVDNILSNAISTSIKIEEEVEEMVSIEGSSVALVASKDVVPLFNEMHLYHGVIAGNSGTAALRAINPINPHHTTACPSSTQKESHESHNHAMLTFEKSATFSELSKISAVKEDKSRSTSSISYMQRNVNSTCNNAMNPRKSDVPTEAIIKHRTITEAPVSADTDSSKKHVCTVCQKQFSHKGHLRDHMRVHTGVKPFVCEHCNKAFAQSGNLHQHLRTHSGEKFICQLCGKSFSRKNTLDKHVQTHINAKEFLCTVCMKSFWLEEAFEKHLRIHSSEENT